MAAAIEKFVSADIPDEIIAQAAELFSLHYGVWGSIAKEKTGVHEGKTSPVLNIIPSRAATRLRAFISYSDLAD
jgi:hypothetical protein